MPGKISGMRIISHATLKPDAPRDVVVGRCFASRLSGVIIIVVARNVAIDGSDQVMYRYACSRRVSGCMPTAELLEFYDETSLSS